MEYTHVVMFLLATAVAVSALSPKLKIPYPVLLMLAGIVIGFIPGFRYIPVDPNIIFLLFLPPLLYDAAIGLSYSDFRKNIGTISTLAITMVFVTMAAIAVTAHFIIPGISWPVAFILGAILSPPDAIAASGIIKDMNLPHRTKTILEGESLVNDASALTAYRITLGVITGGSFVFWEAGVEFILIILGGALLGILMAYLLSLFLKLVPLESTATICLNILIPFVAYQLAENLMVSGVLAVVAFGLSVSSKMSNGKIFSCATINQSRSVWSVIIYMLSGVIFIMIGLEFPQVIPEIPSGMIWPLVISSFIIFIFALLIRIGFIFLHKFRQDKLEFHHRHGHGKDQANEPGSLDWKNALVVGWSGMRGIVSVATAIALPVTLSDGTHFPQRNMVVFITVIVVILMLLIQGVGLPVLIKLLKIEATGDKKEI